MVSVVHCVEMQHCQILKLIYCSLMHGGFLWLEALQYALSLWHLHPYAHQSIFNSSSHFCVSNSERSSASFKPAAQDGDPKVAFTHFGSQ